MQSKDTLGDRMKEFEGQESHRKFIPRLPICVRLDGRKFSSWTRGLQRPFDPRLSGLMVDLTKALVKETGAKVGYSQSDEISLVLFETDPTSQAYFGRRVQKIVSMTAAFASVWFSREVAKVLPEKADSLAFFDSRAWVVPSLFEASNALLWREQDATKNSITMAAQGHFPPAQLHKKTSSDKLKMMAGKGIDWDTYPRHFKRGTYVLRATETGPFDSEEIDELPAKHQARSNPDLEVTRSRIRVASLSPLSTIWNREGVLFRNEPEILKDCPDLNMVMTLLKRPIQEVSAWHYVEVQQKHFGIRFKTETKRLVEMRTGVLL